MKSITVRNVAIGEGKPKICVPIVAATAKEALMAAENFAGLPIDIVEWRADWYEDVLQAGQAVELAGCLREAFKETPILFTFRTEKEGGQKTISVEDYAALNLAVAQSGFVDMVDLELFTGGDMAPQIVEGAHKAHVKVMASRHDFFKTPPKEELMGRFHKMRQLGADILKIAVMPKSKADVLALLALTLEMSEGSDRPIVTMSMSSMGLASRLVGETFGSAITFGAVGKRSAPGQIRVEELAAVLDVVHKG